MYQPCRKAARRFRLCRAGHVIKYPFNFGGAEIRVNTQPRCFAYIFLQAVCPQPIAHFGGAAALPHYRVIDWLACIFIPYNRGLALICNPHGGNFIGRGAYCRYSLSNGGVLNRKYFHGVVLYKAGLRVYLFKFPLRSRHGISALIKKHGTGAGCSFIKR